MYKLVPVTDVEVIGEYELRLTFKDGTIGDVSFVGRGLSAAAHAA